jgi:hypothetical protein
MWPKFSLLLLSLLGTCAIAQPIPNCTELGSMVEYLAKMKNEGLSKSEIQQNIHEIARIKELSSSQIEDWLNNLNWLFKPENKSLNLEGLTKKKKQECETDRVIVNWDKD